MVVLDDIDRQILRILQQDAKTPFSKIAKALNVSEATVHLRVKKLREQGILRGFYADVDPVKVGKKVLAFVLIKADPKYYDSVLRKLSEMSEIYELYDITGEYYALAKVRVASQEDLAKVLDRIGAIDGVQSTYTIYVLRTIKEKKTIEI